MFFLVFFISFFLFSIPGFFISDFSFFNEITKPFFTLPSNLYFITWIILYLFISLSIATLVKENFLKYEKEYKKTLLIHYIFNELYLYLFFIGKSTFLGFTDSVLIFLTSLFLYYETKSLNKKASIYLIFYSAFCFYAMILSFAIYLLNL